MSDNINVLLVGVGKMGIEYAKVLDGLNVPFDAVGRSREGVERFAESTGHKAIEGGVEPYLSNCNIPYQSAILAVSVDKLKDVAIVCMDYGINNILLEKPGGLCYPELEEINNIKDETCSRIFIAYNRRFYASVKKAQQIIEEDGGVTSFHFEFTEWADTISKLNTSGEIKEQWLYANSSHVIDLAFFLGGKPTKWSHYVEGEMSWHKSGAIYSGAGISDKGALFSYQANWKAPGRWAVEMMTKNHRLYLKPIEELQIQKLNSVGLNRLDIDDEIDTVYKPGLYKQVEAFLFRYKSEGLKPLEEQLEDWKIYVLMEA